MQRIITGRLVVAAVFFLILLSLVYGVIRRSLDISPVVSTTTRDFYEIHDDIDDSPTPLETWLPPLNVREISLLNAKEAEYYRANTWNPSNTLEENRKMLVNTFMKTCIDPVEDFLHVSNGIVLKLASRYDGILLQSAGIEEVRKQDLEEIFYLLTDSPTFCRLMRALLAKYKTMFYRPQRAVFLFTKGDANHSSYSVLHHVVNVRMINHVVLSALDCTKHKLLFGETVFHEMLHWYHKVSDNLASERRCKTTSCISKRLRDCKSYNFLKKYGDHVASCFSNDEEYYTIYGIKEENGELVFDPLCEATYTFEQCGYIRGSHTIFKRLSDERNFIVNSRDSSLLKFIKNNPLPKFGDDEFKCVNLKAYEL